MAGNWQRKQTFAQSAGEKSNGKDQNQTQRKNQRKRKSQRLAMRKYSLSLKLITFSRKKVMQSLSIWRILETKSCDQQWTLTLRMCVCRMFNRQKRMMPLFTITKRFNFHTSPQSRKLRFTRISVRLTQSKSGLKIKKFGISTGAWSILTRPSIMERKVCQEIGRPTSLRKVEPKFLVGSNLYLLEKQVKSKLTTCTSYSVRWIKPIATWWCALLGSYPRPTISKQFNFKTQTRPNLPILLLSKLTSS